MSASPPAAPPGLAVPWLPSPVPPAAAVLSDAGVPPLLAPLLARRGVTDADSARAFLEPSLDQLADPLGLAGMAAAVDRLAAAAAAGERVAVVGDYDVDGVSGTALLAAVLTHCGIAVETILPHRLNDGYGFQPVHAERARALGCRLVVTVDCGTSSNAAARAALDAGLDVIVTDHHLPGPELPAGVVQINPRQPCCDYPFEHLSGAGLAFKLAQAVAARCGKRPDPLALLRIACLGTIADLVPLVGENRVIAALGLAALPDTRSPGLRALMRHAGARAPLGADDVGFRLGPRINAAGRLGDAAGALELLLTRDRERAESLAAELDGANRRRQAEEALVVEEAREQVLAACGDGPLAPLLIAWSDGWHRGVVGIAAGRLAREFHRPSILLSVTGDEAVGSGRSISAVELHAFLDRWRPDMVRFGGHAQAIGLTVEAGRLEELRRTWCAAATADWPAEVFDRVHHYELELAPAAVTPELLTQLGRLEPHGMGNRRPLVKVGPFEVAATKRFGSGHLSGVARGARGARGTQTAGGGRFSFVGWRWQEREDELTGPLEALGYLEEDRYRGGPRLRLVEVRPAEAGR